jgi:hypothetical protein
VLIYEKELLASIWGNAFNQPAGTAGDERAATGDECRNIRARGD